MVVTFYKLRNFKNTKRASATVTMKNLRFYQVTRKCNGLFWATYASTLEEVVEAVCQQQGVSTSFLFVGLNIN